MELQFSEQKKEQALLTMNDISEAISQLITWNESILSAAGYYGSQAGMQLLAADCMLITAIGEGIGRCNRLLPGFLDTNFPQIPWSAIIGMRNHIAHGYFELDADLIFEAVKSDIPQLQPVVLKVVDLLSRS